MASASGGKIVLRVYVALPTIVSFHVPREGQV